MIGIIDYGMGNLRSVKKALEYLHFEAAILDDPDEIGTCEKVILPGVGAFEQAMERLRATGMDRAVLRAADAGKPVLGICRGIQFINVMFGGSLYQDLPMQHPSEINHHGHAPYDQPVHHVKIIRESPLYNCLQTETLPVNSYHHQAIKKNSRKP